MGHDVFECLLCVHAVRDVTWMLGATQVGCYCVGQSIASHMFHISDVITPSQSHVLDVTRRNQSLFGEPLTGSLGRSLHRCCRSKPSSMRIRVVGFGLHIEDRWHVALS
jgi:hypothetical protein